MSSRLALLAALGLLAVGGAKPAFADEPPSKEQCIDAHEAAQLRERDGKLIDARKQFRICADDACPKLVREECKPGLEAIQARIPKLRIDARTPGTITIDAQPAPAPAGDGTIELDPGEHVVRLEATNGRFDEQRIVLREAQPVIGIALEVPAPAPAPQPKPIPPEPSRVPIPVYVLGGVAVVGVAAFALLAVSGRAQQNDLDECKPNCRQSDVDDMRRTYLVGDISLAVAAVAAGAAVYLYFRHKRRSTPEAGAFIGATPRASGAQLRAGIRF